MMNFSISLLTLFTSLVAFAGNPYKVSLPTQTEENTSEERIASNDVIPVFLLVGKKNWFDEKDHQKMIEEKGEIKTEFNWGNSDDHGIGFHLGAGYLHHKGTNTGTTQGVGLQFDNNYHIQFMRLKVDGQLSITDIEGENKPDVNGSISFYPHFMVSFDYDQSLGWAPGITIERELDKVDHIYLDTVGWVMAYDFEDADWNVGENFVGFAIGPYWKKLRGSDEKAIPGFQTHLYTYIDGPDLINGMLGVRYGVNKMGIIENPVGFELPGRSHDLTVETKITFDLDGLRISRTKSGKEVRIPIGIFANAVYNGTWLQEVHSEYQEEIQEYKDRIGLNGTQDHNGLFLIGLNIGLSRSW